MQNNKLFVFLFFAMAVFCSLMYVSAGDTTIVEVDVLADEDDSNIISVEVPDRIDFGEIRRGETSDELKIYVNNTGTVDITVTPRLTDASEEIFSYLHFRKQKTHNGTAVPFTRIGDFSFNITKPTMGNDYNDEYFYVILDLRDYGNEVTSDIMDHRANVKFYAVAR